MIRMVNRRAGDRNLTTQTCITSADCKTAPSTSCSPTFKLCGDGVSGITAYQAQVYNVEGVPNTQAGRSGVLTHPPLLHGP